MPTLTGADRQSDGQMGFAGAGWSEEDHVVLRGHEIERAQVRDRLPLDTTSMIEVELLQRFAGREPRRPDPRFTAVTFPRRDFPLQAGHQELFMGPAFRPGPLAQPSHRVPQGRCLQGPGEEAQFGGQIPPRCGVRAHATVPS